MKRSTRRKILYGSIVFFLLACVGVLFYAQGYDFDPSNGHVSKTGGVSLVSNTSAEIYLDGKLAGNTSLLQHGFSQSRLLPGKHRIELRKTDYQTWSKEFVVSAGFVFDLGEAFLPRSQAVIQTLLPDIKPVSYSSNNNYLVGWVGDDLVFYDLNRQQISVTLAQKENIDSTKLNIIWATDNQTAVLYDSKLAWEVDLGGQTYQAVNLPRSFLRSDAQLLAGRVYALSTQKSTPKNLVYFDFNKTSSGTLANGVNSFLVNNGSVFFTSIASSTIWQIKPNQTNPVQLSETALPAKASLINIIITEEATVISTDVGLFTLNAEKKLLKISATVDNLVLSSDKSILAWSVDKELWMLLLKSNPLRSELVTGKPIFLLHKGERIDDLFWLNNQYLYLASVASLDLVEVVSQTQPVTYRLIDKNSEINSIVFPTNREKLIWLNEARLESAEF